MQPRQDQGRITSPVEDVFINHKRFGPIGLDRKHGKAHLGDKEFQDAMFELKELASAMCGFAEGYDPRTAKDWLERLKVRKTGTCLDGCQRDSLSPQSGEKIPPLLRKSLHR
jgi:hypothetical protein